MNRRRTLWHRSELIVRSLVIAGVGLIVGLALVAAAALLPEKLENREVLSAALSNVGTAVFTAAIIGVAYEGFIRRGLVDDMMRIQGGTQSIIDAGLVQLTTDPAEVRYKDLLDQSKELHILPYAPLSWCAQNIEWVIRIARERPLRVTVYLPNPDMYSKALAQQVGADDAGPGPEHCANLARDIRLKWDAARTTLTPSSALTVVQYDGYPHSGFVLGQGTLVLMAPAANGPTNTTDAIYGVFKGSRAADSIRWAEQARSNLLNPTVIEAAGNPRVKAASEIIVLKEEEQSVAGRETAEEHKSQSEGDPL